MNLQVPWNAGNFLTSCKPVSFSRGTLIRPVVLCGAAVWTVTEREELAVLIFGRKIFRRICGAKYENGEWKSGTN